jgi:hypothetical protein
MTVTSTPIYPQTINTPTAQILPANTTALVTLYTAGTNGSKIENIILTNTDTAAAYAITLSIVIGGVTSVIGTVNVPLSAGNTTSAPAVSVMQSTNIPFSYDAFGNPYMYLASGAVLKINSATTVNTSKIVAATCVASGDF